MAVGVAFRRNERKAPPRSCVSQPRKARKSGIGGWISMGLRQGSEQCAYSRQTHQGTSEQTSGFRASADCCESQHFPACGAFHKWPGTVLLAPASAGPGALGLMEQAESYQPARLQVLLFFKAGDYHVTQLSFVPSLLSQEVTEALFEPLFFAMPCCCEVVRGSWCSWRSHASGRA